MFSALLAYFSKVTFQKSIIYNSRYIHRHKHTELHYVYMLHVLKSVMIESKTNFSEHLDFIIQCCAVQISRISHKETARRRVLTSIMVLFYFSFKEECIVLQLSCSYNDPVKQDQTLS